MNLGRLHGLIGGRRKASPGTPRDDRGKSSRPWRDVNATSRLRGAARNERSK